MKIPPSGLFRSVKCTMFPKIASEIPRKPQTEAAIKGTLAHWVVEMKLGNHLVVVGANNVDSYMLHCAEGFLDYIKMNNPNGIVPKAEQKLQMFYSLSNGRIDVWWLDGKKLYVLDYKYGKVPVDAYENYQLVAYAKSLIYTFSLDVTELHLGIYQPNTYKDDSRITEWVCTPNEIQPQVLEINKMADDILMNRAVFKTGSHCKYCPAMLKCPAHDEAVKLAMILVSDKPLRNMTNEEMSLQALYIDDAMQTLKFRQTALNGEIEGLMKRGQPFKHWELKSTLGTLKWTASVEHIKQLGELYGIKTTNETPITPAQASKLKIPRPVIDAISSRSNGRLELKKVDLSKNPFKKLKEQ